MVNVVAALQKCQGWTMSRVGIADNPFRLACTFDDPASMDEIEDRWPDRTVPSDILEFWSACRQARLFEDIDYGQWGLLLLSPAASAARTALERHQRSADIFSEDIVIGEFLGDQELLIVAPSEVHSRRLLVALPLDERAEWPGVADNLGAFLVAYLDHTGNKYWESGGS
jgi:hypothetical protein